MILIFHSVIKPLTYAIEDVIHFFNVPVTLYSLSELIFHEIKINLNKLPFEVVQFNISKIKSENVII